MSSAPSLFVSHGAPTFALEPGLLGPALSQLGRDIRPRVTAILVVSAHWQTHGVRVMAAARPETVHDFGGFPEELYALRYPAPGAPQYAAKACALLASAGFASELDASRGLDHGAWVPLRYLAPEADLPVFQVSLPEDADPKTAFDIGKALAPLRAEGVLLMGSGSLTHNLHDVFRGTVDREYAQNFTRWVESSLKKDDTDALLDYRARAPEALRAHPSDEHFLPLLTAMGARAGGDRLRILSGGVTYGVLSMDSFVWDH
ncbi:MAG TPA: class III extradiol ring-cleavage dioxygenase [Steroidobacteraceae bacterium]|jgi:4,5-DOPA dioxygenase extradiol